MKVTVEVSEMRKALSVAGRAINSRQVIPTFGNVLFMVTPDGVKLCGGDIGHRITTAVAGTANGQGEFLAPFSLFSKLLARLPDGGTVELNPMGTDLSVTHGKSKYNLPTFNAADYPREPAVSGSKFRFPAGLLQNALSTIAYAMSNDDLRPIISSVLMEIEGENATFAATDTHRLSTYTLPVKIGAASKQGYEISAILPARVVNALRAIVPNSDDEVEITLGGAAIECGLPGDVLIYSSLIAGKYPSWKRIVPSLESLENGFTANKSDLVASVKRLLLFSDADRIVFDPGGMVLNLSSQHDISGKGQEEVFADFTGAMERCAFSGKFLLDVLGSLPGNTVTFRMCGAVRPTIVECEDNDAALHIIMPMHNVS